MSTECHDPTDVSDAQWAVLQLLLPKPKWRPGGPGRKPVELRRVINGGLVHESPAGLDTWWIDHHVLDMINPNRPRCAPCQSLTNARTDIPQTKRLTA